MEKYLYFRKNADVDDDDGIDDSIYVPVSRITGISPIAATKTAVKFRSVNNESGNIGEDLSVVSDAVVLVHTAGYAKEILQAICEAINEGPHSDGCITIADFSTTTIDDATVRTQLVHPEITGINAISVAAALS